MNKTAELRKLELELGKKATTYLNLKIDNEVRPQIREEVRKEYEAKSNELLDEMKFYQENDFSMFGVRKCTMLEQMGCIREQRRRTILYLLANGWITDKNIMKADVWNGKPITKKSMGGRTTLP